MKHKRNKSRLWFYIAFLIGIISYYRYRNLIYSIVILGIAALFFLCIKSGVKRHTSSLKNKRFINSGISTVDKMEGEEFEEFLLAHFTKMGYKVNTTPKTGDYGADLIATNGFTKIVIQAKRWTNKVGTAAVQQVLASKEYYKANKCMVISNNYFTKNATNLANKAQVELWDRDKLLNIMKKVKGKKTIEKNFSYEKIKKINQRHLCKKCGAEMILKEGKYGKFYGCSNYPKCKYTEKL